MSKAHERNSQWKNIDKDLFIDLYCNKKYSIAKTAEVLGVDRRLVRRRLKRWDIPSRTYEEQMKVEIEAGTFLEVHKHQQIEGSFKRSRKNYLRIAKENYEWKCMTCGAIQTNEHFDLVVHHRDGDNRNNDSRSLMVLCQGCHCRLHGFGKVINSKKK
jgi:hypothetical protein